MKICLKHILFLFIGIVVLISYPQLFADSEARPYDFKIVTSNNKYIFIMLANKGFGRYDPEIRKIYKQSGLYKNDGSGTPLWTIGWYAFTVYPSSDGVHLVRMGPWASSYADLALAFYKNGEATKSYDIIDLIHDESKLDFTVSHVDWESEYNFDDDKLLFTLKTKDDQNYTFSVKTGEILNKTLQQTS
jgi:hypothetical protein